MHSNVTAQECGLPNLDGSRKQVEWASALRNGTIQFIWRQGWYGTSDEFCNGIKSLPISAKWWIDNRASCVEESRLFLGLEYNTSSGADY